jgi:hypothetical protein
LLLTGGGLAAIAIVVVSAAFVRARRGNRRRGESLSMPG